MTRIIAGFAGSLSLVVPEAGTRPTSDRVREAIFSALDSRDLLHGATVLDLYAGSGALGLEAASRGAASVTLVDRAAAAVTACRRNVAVVLKSAPANPPRIDVTSLPVLSFLAGRGTNFDVVFIDPPYEMTDDELCRALVALVPRLNPHATVVIERSSRSKEPAWPDGLALDRSRVHGDTTLWWVSAS